MAETIIPPETRYEVPRDRGPIKKMGPMGFCIYCLSQPPTVLTDEHIIADGLGGNLLLTQASCLSCAKITCRSETHLITNSLQFARSVAEVRSRKRKPTDRVVRVHFEDSPPGEETEIVLDGKTPFMTAFPTTDDLPGIFRGAFRSEAAVIRIPLFGPKDLFKRGVQWLGKKGEFRLSYNFHPGWIGQALAKTAHAYAYAILGQDAFTPLLPKYILEDNPPWNGYLIGSYGTELGDFSSLHVIDIFTADAKIWTGSALAERPVYVVFLRLFAYQPTPAFIIVVGMPIGDPLPNLLKLDIKEAI